MHRVAYVLGGGLVERICRDHSFRKCAEGGATCMPLAVVVEVALPGEQGVGEELQGSQLP
ncbi:hypothetical protein D3C84_1202300 [compost metagenome]